VTQPDTTERDAVGFASATRPLVVKLGGELLEHSGHLAAVVAAVSDIRSQQTEVVVVHGGGKEIDAALKAAGIEKRQVDGLRITDEATLAIVVAVLAGTVNTRLVAALTTAGVPAVGLTGADAGCALSARAAPHRTRNGELVDLGRVGVPIGDGDVSLLTTLVAAGFVPVIACIGVDRDGRLLNVNADTLAGNISARLQAGRLVVAGTTAGVLGSDGGTVSALDVAEIGVFVSEGTATAGMVAKLRACEHALAHGAADVVIVDGRDRAALVSAAIGDVAAGMTRITMGRRGPAEAGHYR
jgi:acetylglutamate kinase